MPGKSTLVFLSAMLTGTVVAVLPLRAASDPDWPFELLPKPSAPVFNPPPPVTAPGADHPLPGAPPPGPLPTGEYVAPNDLTIKLDQTEGKSFKLSGEVWLDGPSPTAKYPNDRPEGFGLFLREVDGLHRYEANTSLMRAKRRLLGGLPLTKIVPVASLPGFPLQAWISFSVVATGEKISFTFGQYSGEIPGPLDKDGENEIALVTGTKLRNIHLEILPEAKKAP